MMKKPLRHDRKNDPFFDLEQAASASECTGLMPAQIQTGAQGEDLSALQGIHRIKPPKEK